MKSWIVNQVMMWKEYHNTVPIRNKHFELHQEVWANRTYAYKYKLHICRIMQHNQNLRTLHVRENMRFQKTFPLFTELRNLQVYFKSYESLFFYGTA